MNINELIQISRYYGSNPEYILEGGGNTSYKDDKYLYIKASGVSLSSIDKNGFIKLEREKLNDIWQKEFPSEYKEREALFKEYLKYSIADPDERCTRRPSVETLLHALLPYRFVIHTHPSFVNGITCSKEGEEAVKRLFSDSRVLWVPSVNPGYILAKTLKERIEQLMNSGSAWPEIIFLENHGLIVAADTVRKIKEISEFVIKRIKTEVKTVPDNRPVKANRTRAAEIAPAVRMLLMNSRLKTATATEQGSSICTFYTDKSVEQLVSTRKIFNRLPLTLTPDHIVYAGFKALFIPEEHELEKQYKQIKRGISDYLTINRVKPKIVAIENLGIFACGVSSNDAAAALKLFLDALKVYTYTESFGGVKPMPEDQVEFIKKWEGESYRRKVMLNRQKEGSSVVREKIAVVTGGAQGIGAGIAKGLLQEGCNVVIADLKAQNLSENKYQTIIADVTDEKSVKDMITETVLLYGGIDLLVSNAGVLKAGSLDSMDYKSFKFVTDVNYSGFYLCTKYASKIMKIQNRFNSEYFMDIIQINSKSGLLGSRKNFAYAGSKFGGIGLTQSFALELVEYNIKVNAICPGNFFDGPLWSNPKNGLFIQYLKASKVPGAKSIEDVRRYYESKVPMKRGCQIEDINRALIYLVEQKYETGQALPVTGGQIMLK